ncbi:MAG: DNA-3-methyladenine glycosylase 2 family protein [Oscillospiraceae bacterium]|jgi:N-glycosylase/DNA lyase|nr:DNA-3-methyladenine glycosylase 2 family protein [Oscillospiraceae bacterium]
MTTHILCSAADLSLTATFECGQCFRWEPYAGGDTRLGFAPADSAALEADINCGADKVTVSYVGVAFGRVVRVFERGGEIHIDAPEVDLPLWRAYFDLDRDYGAVGERVRIVNDFMSEATGYGRGLRILRQEPWEALCSFIISQCNNIPRIKSIIRKLCELFGASLGGGHFAFPDAETLAALDEADLAPLRAGYRAAYIVAAARAVAFGDCDLAAIAAMSGNDAIRALQQLQGVGLKVASCAALYGLARHDAFPIDTWMKKALKLRFPPDFDPIVFGEDAGVAQQYIFYYERSLSGR